MFLLTTKNRQQNICLYYTYICPRYVKVCIKVARQFFRVNTSQVWALTTSGAINKDLEKLQPQLY